jgi:hypothetical protein
MKKALLIIGLVCAVLIVFVIGYLALVAVEGSTLDKESKAYVDEVTPKILADLRKDTFLAYASDELKNWVKPEELDKLFASFTKLGQFEEYRGSIGQAHISLTMRAGKVITGHYVAQAEFSTGPAEIQIVTVKRGRTWFVQMFRINSMAL